MILRNKQHYKLQKRVDKEKLQVYNLERKGNGVFECKYSKTLFFCNQNQS